jgi:multidrug efflux pump subunit AcrB
MAPTRLTPRARWKRRWPSHARAAAAGVTLYPALHRPANFIESALGGIDRDLVIGALMIALVLLLILRDWRVVLIAFVSIPLSLLAALVVLDAWGRRSTR